MPRQNFTHYAQLNNVFLPTQGFAHQLVDGLFYGFYAHISCTNVVHKMCSYATQRAAYTQSKTKALAYLLK